jgi:hypothetical protein
MYRFRRAKFTGIVLLAIMGALAFGAIVMLLWNALMPDIFHLPIIDFWHALGLLVLAKILFGGFRGGFGYRGRWKDKLQQRWMSMSPEEREKFSQELRRGRRSCPGEPSQQYGPSAPKPDESSAQA